jgi:hypothetical protein
VVRTVFGLGKAKMSAVLTIAYPDRYGVWNNTSEAGLKAVGLWPDFNHGTGSGEKYETVNRLLNQLAKDLQIHGLKRTKQFIPWPDTRRLWRPHLTPERADFLETFLPPREPVPLATSP